MKLGFHLSANIDLNVTLIVGQSKFIYCENTYLLSQLQNLITKNSLVRELFIYQIITLLTVSNNQIFPSTFDESAIVGVVAIFS